MHVAVVSVTMVKVKVDGETIIPLTVMHGRRKTKLIQR